MDLGCSDNTCYQVLNRHPGDYMTCTIGYDQLPMNTCMYENAFHPGTEWWWTWYTHHYANKALSVYSMQESERYVIMSWAQTHTHAHKYTMFCQLFFFCQINFFIKILYIALVQIIMKSLIRWSDQYHLRANWVVKCYGISPFPSFINLLWTNHEDCS